MSLQLSTPDDQWGVGWVGVGGPPSLLTAHVTSNSQPMMTNWRVGSVVGQGSPLLISLQLATPDDQWGGPPLHSLCHQPS